MRTKLKIQIFSVLIGLTSIACTPAASEPETSQSENPTSVTKENDEGEFNTGASSTVVTGASLADLDFTCTTEVAADNGGGYTYNGSNYAGSKLTCNPTFPKNSSLSISDTSSEIVTRSEGVSFAWSITRLYGEFFENYICFTGDDESTIRYTCLFDEVNLAAQVVVNMSASADQSLGLSVNVKTVDHPVAFKNDCDDHPDWAFFNSFGTGERSNPFVICNGVQLAHLRTEYSANRAPDAMNAYIRIGRDLGVVTGSQTIGDSSNPFRGVVQGNGYSFSLSVDIGMSSSTYLGFIRYALGATIDYFTINQFNVYGTLSSAEQYVGSLVGYAKNSEISRITVKTVTQNLAFNGSVSVCTYSGLVGVAENSTIDQVSIDSVEITAPASSNSCSVAHATGIVGRLTSSSRLSNAVVKAVYTNLGGNMTWSTSGAVGRVVDSASSIYNVIVEQTQFVGGASFAGIVDVNAGTIERVSANSFRYSCDSAGAHVCSVAGIANSNQASAAIKRAFVRFDSQSNVADASNSLYTYGITRSNDGTISDCAVFGTIPLRSAGNSTIAGIVEGSTGAVSRCFAAVAYSGTGATPAGVSNRNTGTFSSVFWDEILAPNGTLDSSMGDLVGVESKTTTQLKTQSTFVGWDFQSNWSILSNSYPAIR